MKPIIKAIEDILAKTYRFDPIASASDFLLSEEDIATLNIPNDKRAAVIFIEENEDIDVGIYFNKSIKKSLESDDPTVSLHTKNLDSLCVVAEEVSHFHLMLHRKFHKLQTNRMELEWQAEVDKLLVSSHLLSEQYRKSHLAQLRNYLYELGIESFADDAEYKVANDLAARFWHAYEKRSDRSDDLRNCPVLDSILNRFYRSSYGQKHTLLGQVAVSAA